MLVACAVFFGAAATAYAADPASFSPQVIRTITFDSANATDTFDTIAPFVVPGETPTAVWGRTTHFARGGVGSGLWCAGKLSPSGLPGSSWTSYPAYTRGYAILALPELAQYYSSRFSLYYLMPTIGGADDYAFRMGFSPVAYTGPDGPPGAIQDPENPVSLVSAWTKLEYDLTDGRLGSSRAPVWVSAQFVDRLEGAAQGSNGQGATIDDLQVTGYMFGPVRTLAPSSVTSTSVSLSWSSPASSRSNSAYDTRTINYRVWRSPKSQNTWTDLTPSKISTKSFTDSTVARGTAYEYRVQAWEPSGDKYGEPSLSVDAVTLGAQPGVLKGTVKTGAVGLADVNVTLSGGAGATITAANGTYTLSNVDPGTYSVVFSKAGYTSKTRNAVNISSLTTTTVDESLVIIPGSLEGTVTSSGSGLPGVSVTLSGGGGATTTAANGTYRISGIAPGNSYTATYSRTGYVNQAPSVSISADTTTTKSIVLVDSTAPSPPTGLGYSTVTTSSVTLSWTASTDLGSGMDYYKVYNGATYLGRTPGTGVTYTATGLPQGQTATFTVVAFDIAGNESAHSAAKTVTTVDMGSADKAPGSTPTTVTLGNGVKVVVAFDPSSSAGSVLVTATPVLPEGAPPLAGFQVLGQTFEIDFIGSENGTITITLPYDHDPLTHPEAIMVKHWTDGAWVTIKPVVNTVAHTVTFDTPSLSPFVLGEVDTVTAVIDSISPSTVTYGSSVAFLGHGVDSLHPSPFTYEWRRNTQVGTILSTSYSFSTLALPVGTYLVWLKATCSNSTASWTSRTITVNAAPFPPTPTPTTQGVYRFRSMTTFGTYLWTNDVSERDTIRNTLTNNWFYEGEAYGINTANTANSDQMWRFKSKTLWTYFYTADPAEMATVKNDPNAIWAYEGPVWKVSRNTQAGKPVWRFRCLKNPTYFWTQDPVEMATIRDTLQADYFLEGIAYYHGQ